MEIARQGCTVIVPFREEMAKRHLKVAGDLGRVIFMVSVDTRLIGIPIDFGTVGI
jgi:NADH dehydrogenase (ubiquinone) 1 alpha subcomplex subunit 9